MQTVTPDAILNDIDAQIIYFQYSYSTHPQYGCAEAVNDYFVIGGYSSYFPYLYSIVYSNGLSKLFSYRIDFEMPFKNKASLLITFYMLGPGNEAIYVQCYYVGIAEVLGISESIKKFRFYREGGATVLRPYTVLLSKKYGLMSFFDLNYLANFVEGSTPEFYNVAGIQSPTVKAGLYFSDWTNYFPFDENDIQI